MSIIVLPGHMVKLFSELLTSACQSDIGNERRGGGRRIGVQRAKVTAMAVVVGMIYRFIFGSLAQIK